MRSPHWSMPLWSPHPDCDLLGRRTSPGAHRTSIFRSAAVAERTCVVRAKSRMPSTLGSGQQSESLHAIVILPEITHQHAKGLIDVERPDGNHLLEISPVLCPVEEGFE